MPLSTISIPVEVKNDTKKGWRSVYSTAASQTEQMNKYLQLVPIINTKKFESQFHRLESMVKDGALDKWAGKSLSKSGKNGWSYNLKESMTGSLDQLRQAISDIKKQFSQGKFSTKDAGLAQSWLKDAQFLERSWSRTNAQAEKYAHVDKAVAKDKERAKLARERERAEGRIVSYQHTIDKYKKNIANYDNKLYRDVQKRLTAEQQIAAALRTQEQIYREVGDKRKAASVARQATKWENSASETSSQLANWTGNDKGLIASWNPSNIKHQLTAINRDLTNKVGRENILNLPIKVTGWEQDVARLRASVKEVEKSFTVGGKKFKITGFDDALRQLPQIDKLVQKGVKGADAWQHKLNNYLQSHVDVANKYQTYQNKIIEGQKREAKERERANAGLLKQSNILGRLSMIASRYFSIYSVIRFAQNIAKTTGYFEQQQVALEGILGSATKAQKVLNDIKGFALQSPFQTKELVGFTKQLSAFGLKSDELFPRVKELADISAGLGVDMGRIILAYGQVKAAAVLRGQELRQFTEAGIPMVEELAKRFTALNGTLVTTGEVFKLISQRQVSFEMVADVLSSMTQEGGKFYKMQENITNTLYGQMQKLKDMWTLALDDMGKSGGSMLMGVVKLLQVMTKNMKTFAIALGTTFATAKVASFFATVTGGFKGMIARMKEVISLKTLASGAIGLAAGAVAGIISKIVTEVGKLNKKLEEVDTSFAKEIEKTKQGLDSLLNKLQEFEPGTKAYSDALGTLAQNYGDYIGSGMLNRLKQEEEQAKLTAAEFKNLADQIKAAMDNYNEYQKAEQKKGVINQEIGERTASNRKDVRNNLRSLTSTTDGFNNLVEDYVERYGNPKNKKQNKLRLDMVDKVTDLWSEAVNEFVQGEDLSEGAFDKIFQDKLKKQFESITDKQLETFSTVGKFQVFGDNFESLLDNAFEARRMNQADLESTDYWKLNNYFDKVKPGEAYDKILSGEHKGKEDGFAYQHNLESEYLKALRSALNDFSTDRGISLPSELTDALKGEMMNIDGEEKEIIAVDNKKIESVNNLLTSFADTITNPDALNFIKQLHNVFNEKVNVKTERAAIVADRMEANSKYRFSDDAAVRGIWKRYNPNDNNYADLRNKLPGEEEKLQKEIKSYKSDGVVDEKDKKTVASLEKQLEAVKVLMSNSYFGISAKDKSGGGGAFDFELSEFVNNLKDAYKTYKTATQETGAETGLAYMKNDPKMVERFAGFFSKGLAKNGSDAFAKNGKEGGADIMIGNKSLRSILENAFIKSGFEDGVLDFEKGINDIASAMEEYYHGNEKLRANYMREAKNLRNYANSIAKDNVAAMASKLSTSLKELSDTFNRTQQNVETYRQFIQNGTDSMLGGKIGVTREQALTPDSSAAFEYVQKMASKYNDMYKFVGGTNESGVVSVDNVKSPQDIQGLIDRISAQILLNNKNFGTTELGKSGEQLKSALDKYLKQILDEMKSISGDVITGNKLEDAIAKASRLATVAGTNLEFEKNKQANIGASDNGAAVAKYNKEIEESAKKVLEEFLNDNKFEVLFSEQGLFKNGVKWNELREKLQQIVDKLPDDQKDLKDEIMYNFDNTQKNANMIQNAEKGDLSQIANIFDIFKNSRRRNEEEWSKLDNERIDLETRAKEPGGLSVEEQARLQTVNGRLGDLGDHGQNQTQSDIQAAIEAIKKLGDAASNTGSILTEAFTKTIDAAKSLSNAINKAYDVMNDGENPEWMQDMDGVLSDLSENFEAMVAPIFAVIAAITALTIAVTVLSVVCAPLLYIMLALAAAAIVMAVIMTAAQQHDRELERENEKLAEGIEDLDRKIQNLENTMTNLNAAAERMAGLDAMKKNLAAVALNSDKAAASMEKAQKAAQQYANEEEKKNTDEDKLKDYKDDEEQYLQEAQEARDAFINGVKEAIDDITSDADSWAEAMSNAIRSAFQNGENAARAFRSTVKQMMGDVVEQMLLTEILAPQMQKALDKWTGREDLQEKLDKKEITEDEFYEQLYGNLKDENRAKTFYNEASEAGDAMIDAVDGLPDYIQELFKFKENDSRLSGGIESVTEDTARRLEALLNSTLGEQLLTRLNTDTLVASVGGISNQLRAMVGSQKVIETNTKAIMSAIEDFRNNVRPMYVKMT